MLNFGTVKVNVSGNNKLLSEKSDIVTALQAREVKDLGGDKAYTVDINFTQNKLEVSGSDGEYGFNGKLPYNGFPSPKQIIVDVLAFINAQRVANQFNSPGIISINPTTGDQSFLPND